MRVGIFSEAHVPEGVTVTERLREVVDEAVLADELGFDFFGVGEQHFGGVVVDGHELATSSTPEVTHAFIAARTEQIRLRPMSVNLIPFNHPVRIAEQVAAIDVLSNGRAELGGARSNNPSTLEAFGIKAENTRSYRNEALKVIVTALSQERFEFHGEYYDIPERRLVPRPVQSPHPPIAISATGVESHREAGKMGIGVMMGNTSAGWEYAHECATAYRDAIADVEPIGPCVHNSLGMISTAVACAPTRAQAFEEGSPVAVRWMEAILHLYTVLAEKAPDYAYLGNIRKLEARIRDVEYIVDSSPYITIGTPEFFVERARRIHEMGADEWILRVDGMGHELNCRTIELLGREVLPEVHRLVRSGVSL
jgi:alkanesulfonate monooxygenase SsuD/methylene tetrahydromethanopterin reductase-like flavin-dependent oxidoreductase (luciferase family)